jgi:alpha-ketoglutarate-dependent taurine dioxygenase
VRDAIEDALVENELIIFRNQDISSEDLIAFGRRFGELTVHPFAPSDENVSVLIKFRNDETNPPFRTDVWHSDETFRKEPPKATILVAKEVPAIGGDTMFASMSAAFVKVGNAGAVRQAQGRPRRLRRRGGMDAHARGLGADRRDDRLPQVRMALAGPGGPSLPRRTPRSAAASVRWSQSVA